MSSSYPAPRGVSALFVPVVALVACVVPSGTPCAQTVVDRSTGYDEEAGVPLDPGQSDDDWRIDAGGVLVGAFVVSEPPGEWLEPGAASAWIGFEGPGSPAPPGELVFTTSVVLGADEAPLARWSGRFAADEAVLDVRVNGESTGIASQDGASEWTDAPPEAGLGLFREGSNTIEFVVENGGVEDNPMGLRVEIAVRTSPPVPAGHQVPGDCNQDARLDISDGICLLGYLFIGTPAGLPCDGGRGGDAGNLALLDADGEGALDVTDAVRVFQHLFLGGPPHVLGLECVPLEGCPDVCSPAV